MRSFLGLSAAAAVLAATPLAAQHRVDTYEATSEASAVDDQTQAHDLAFADDAHERMTVSVKLGDTGPFQFLVDTGANRSAVSRQVASSLKLPRGQSVVMHSVSGASVVETAEVGNLQLNDRVVREVSAALLDGKRMGADGILGVDALRSQRVLFDFKARTMTITPSAEKPALDETDKDTIVVTGRLKNGRLLLTNAFAEGRKVAVVVDTGSEITIGNEALRRRLASLRLLRRSGPIQLHSVTGQTIPGEYMFIKELEVGGAKLTNLAIVFADAHTFGQLKLDKRPALLLGMNAIRAFDRVSIDFATRKLRLKMPERSALQDVMMAAR